MKEERRNETNETGEDVSEPLHVVTKCEKSEYNVYTVKKSKELRCNSSRVPPHTACSVRVVPKL